MKPKIRLKEALCQGVMLATFLMILRYFYEILI